MRSRGCKTTVREVATAFGTQIRCLECMKVQNVGTIGRTILKIVLQIAVTVLIDSICKFGWH